MQINKETITKDDLVDCINLVEKIRSESYWSIPESDEKLLTELKTKAGLIVQAEVKCLGLQKGFYVFVLEMNNGTSKIFNCNPDDIDFYNMCIPKAIEMDKNPEMRKRRLEEFNKKSDENIKGKMLLSVDDAIKNLADKLN